MVEGKGHSLLGQNWLNPLHIDWTQVSSIKGDTQLDEMLHEFSDLFQDELGTVKDFKASLYFKESAHPMFF